MGKENLSSNGIQITGFGHYFPEKVLTNEEIRARLKYPEMHPAEKAVIGDIGVDARFRANEKETAEFMAAKASEMALKDAGLKPEDIDLYILANWTDRYYLPDLAPQASQLTGTKNALAFDISTACTGFVHGVQTASMYLLSGKFKRAIVVGSERFSVRVKEGGYGEFTGGDAAGAVILEYTGDKSCGIIDMFLKDNADLKYIITCPAPKGLTKSYPDLIPNAIADTLKSESYLMDNNNLSAEDVDWLVPHPGTILVVRGVSDGSRIPKAKQLSNFSYCGNTSAASIPIVLSENKHKGKFKKGDVFVCPAVGGGWYYGGVLFKL